MMQIANSNDSFKIKIIKSASVALFLTSLLVFWGPLTIYLNNAPEFAFTLSVLLQHLIIPLVIYFGVLTLVLVILPQRFRLYQTGLLICLVLATAAWLQATVLPWSHGVFDGTDIEWDRYTSRYIIDGFLWGGIAVLFILKRKFVFRNAHKLAFAILLIQIGGSIVLYVDIRREELTKNRFQLTNFDKYSFSKEKNILMVVLDTTEVPLFRKALENHPEYKTKLDGFYFFPDTLSSYPSTLAAFAQMLTGMLYKNEEPFDLYKKKAFLSETSLPKRLKEEGIHTFLETDYERTFFIDPAVADNVIEGQVFEMDDHLLLMSLFRQLPFPAKRYLIEHAADLPFSSLLPGSSSTKSQEKPQCLDLSNVPYPEDFSIYTDELNHTVKYEFDYFFNTRLRQPSFKLFHMPGTHRHNRSFAKSKSRMEDLDVCMEYLFDVFDAFKESGIYDQSVIVILADHGARVVGEANKDNFNAILLIKPFNSSGTMNVSDRSMSLGDLPSLVYALSTTNNQYGGKLNTYFSMHSAPETRYVYHYIWHGWENVYLPQLTEYSITGCVESNDLIATGRSFVKRDRHAIAFDDKHVAVNFSDGKGAEYLEGVWEETPEGAMPKQNGWEAPSVFLYFTHPLSPNASYHAQIVYSNPATEPNSTNRTYVRNGLSEYIALEETTGIVTSRIPVRVYSRANKEVRFRFDVPPDSNFILKSLDLFTDSSPCVSLGKEYKLSMEFPENTALLGEGWHSMESFHTWAGSGDRALLHFRINKPESDVVFRFTGAVFVKPGIVERQRVGISVNGEKLKDIEITTLEDKDYYVAIPQGLIKSNEVTVLFDLPDAVVPAEVGGYDIRPLALRVSSIEMKEIGAHYVEGLDTMAPYLSSGWSWREQDYIWNNGYKAHMEFRVGKPVNDLQFVFRCGALIIPEKVKKQRIIVLANGQKLKEFEKTTADIEIFKVVIPKEAVTNGQVNLTFELPDAVSPKEIGSGADTRRLAIALNSIMLK